MRKPVKIKQIQTSYFQKRSKTDTTNEPCLRKTLPPLKHFASTTTDTPNKTEVEKINFQETLRTQISFLMDARSLDSRKPELLERGTVGKLCNKSLRELRLSAHILKVLRMLKVYKISFSTITIGKKHKWLLALIRLCSGKSSN